MAKENTGQVMVTSTLRDPIVWYKFEKEGKIKIKMQKNGFLRKYTRRQK